MAFTKVTGPGIHTLSNIISHNIDSSGIISATKFVGDSFEGPITGDLVTNDWITHEGDTDTKIGFPNNDQVEIQTGGSTAIHVSSTQKVGINTTDPAEKLSVSVPDGQRENFAKFEQLGQQNFFIQGQWGGKDIGGASGTLLYGSGTLALRASTSGNAHIVNLASGDIGIGTDNPTDTLHVGKLNSNHGIKLERYGATNPGSSTIQVQSNGALSVTSTDSFSLRTNSGVLDITSAGLVGIGTTVMGRGGADELNIATTGDTGITIRSGTSNEGNIYFADSDQSGNGQQRGIVRFDHSDDSMRFYTANGNNWPTEKLRIKSTGEVGIGTTAPGQKVHISASSGDVYFQTDTTVNGGLILHVDGTQRGLFANDSAFSGTKTDIGIGAKGNMIFRTGTSSYDESLRITSDGKVGIGTDVFYDNSTKLEVRGRINTVGSASTGSLNYGNGTVVNIGSLTPHNLQLMTGNSTRMRIYDGTGDGSHGVALSIGSTGITKFHDTGRTYTNVLQSYHQEAGYITHYTARTTSGSDRYRRMLDIVSIGGNPHGSSIRFLTSNDGENPAIGKERMRIMHGNGVLIQDEGSLSHNQNHPHRSCPGLLTVQNGAGESNRTDTAVGVYAPPTGGFVNYADYELATKLISISNSNCNIIMAKNGEPIVIEDSRGSWSHYNKLPNYLLGLPCTDCINNTSFTLTLYADFLVFLLRNNGWNGITNTSNFATGWREIESGTNIGPAGSVTKLYCKSIPAGSYTWDNDSAMYFFRLA